MRKARAIVLAGLGAVSLTGVAAAASQQTHTMSVPLPDGSVARIEYVGNVAPKVIIDPVPFPRMMFPFGIFDRSAAEMRRQIDSMIRQMERMPSGPVRGAPGMNIAGYGDVPAGSSSVTVVSTSNGTRTCTRTTEITSQGAGKPPKVVSNVSGDCADAAPAGKPDPTA